MKNETTNILNETMSLLQNLSNACDKTLKLKQETNDIIVELLKQMHEFECKLNRKF